MQVVGRRYDTLEPVAIEIANGRLQSLAAPSSDANGRGAKLPIVAPGFVDVQINGYGGREFNDFALSVEQVRQISRDQDACGVTRYCPTTITHSFELLSHATKMIAAACDELPEVASRVAGIHLEGPYISREDGPRGAHPLEHCRPPDWDEFCRLQEGARGRIIIVTMSPEYEGSADFIAKATASGVIIAIGHTAASSEQIKAAVDAGARFSTHLGNAAHGQIRRHPNYIWDQLAEDRLWASLIVDGHHLPASVVKSFVRGKTPQRCLIVSDILGLGGMPPGRYDKPGLGPIEVLEDGRLVVAGQRQYLAGAGLPIGVAIPNVMRMAGVDLATAIEMTSIRPAELLGETPVRLAAGANADLVLFELGDRLQVTATIKAGELVYGTLPSLAS